MTRSPVILSLIFISFAATPKADTLVAPNELETVASNGSQNAFGSSGVRWLNVYNPSEFLAAMPHGGSINQISFRIDESDRETFTSTLSDVEIRMSTSPSLAPDLPIPFAESVGPDEKTVFPRGAVTFSVASAASGPNRFTVTFALKNAFDYDPRKGSLAVDLWIYERATHRLLIDSTSLDSIAAVGPVIASRSFGTTGALVLQIDFSPIPEPTVVSLLAAAGVLAAAARGRSL